jgi:hypothetical protein
MPSRWNELTVQQFLFILSRDAWLKSEDIIVRVFLGIKRSLIRRMDDYQKYCIVQQMQALNSSTFCDRFILDRLGRLKGPKPRLKGVTFGQFIFADSYFESYCNGKQEDLDRFIACYYLDGEFNDDDIDVRADYIKRFSREERIAIFQNYALIREWLAKSYSNVFQKADSKKKKPTQKSGGWVRVFDIMCGDSPEKYKDLEAMPLSQALRFLNNRIKEYQKHGSRIR